MKKLFVVALCAAMALVYASCAYGNADELTLEDYDVYEDGNVILKSVDFMENRVIFGEQFADRDVETARGVKIGSTVREVADAYGNIPARIDDGDRDEDAIEIYADFLDRGGANDLKRNFGTFDYQVIYDLVRFDGELLSVEEFDEIAPPPGSDEVLAFYQDNPDEQTYLLIFQIKDNMVENITISAHTLGWFVGGWRD